MINVYLKDLYTGELITVGKEYNDRTSATKAAQDYTKAHGLPWDKYQRFWLSEDNKGTYCDFGSWSYWLYYEGEV